MTDYIKRENAKRAVWGCTRDTGIDEAPFEYAEGLLEDVPAEDVVPVVRCKDCKHWDEHSQYGYDSENGVYGNYCMLWTPEDDFYAVETPEDGFCYCGERKDDESVDS